MQATHYQLSYRKTHFSMWKRAKGSPTQRGSELWNLFQPHSFFCFVVGFGCGRSSVYLPSAPLVLNLWTFLNIYFYFILWTAFFKPHWCGFSSCTWPLKQLCSFPCYACYVTWYHWDDDGLYESLDLGYTVGCLVFRVCVRHTQASSCLIDVLSPTL